MLSVLLIIYSTQVNLSTLTDTTNVLGLALPRDSADNLYLDEVQVQVANEDCLSPSAQLVELTFENNVDCKWKSCKRVFLLSGKQCRLLIMVSQLALYQSRFY